MRSFKSLSTSLLLVSLVTWSVLSAEFGNTTIYTNLSNTLNRRAHQFTMPENGTITAVSVYHNAGASGQMQLGVYADNGSNQPGAKLGGTAKTNIATTTGWQTINLTTPTSQISSGTKIWLAFMYQTGSNQRFGSVSGASYVSSTTTTWSTSGDNMTNPFGAVGTPSSAAYSLKATYTPAGYSYTLTVTVSNGTVTKNPDQPSYPSGQTVTLTATPASCYLWPGNWSGDVTGTTNPVTITMNANKNITANFAADPVCAGTDPRWPSQVNATGQNMKLEGNFNMVGDLNMINQNKIHIFEKMGQGAREITLDRCGLDVLESSSWGFGRINISARNGIIASGKITCSEVVVTATPVFPDYVFGKDYKLTSLKETKRYIEKNGKLPGMVSAADVKKNGLSVGVIQTQLLEKIEEMTLHMIRMQEKMEKMQKRINELEVGKK